MIYLFIISLALSLIFLTTSADAAVITVCSSGCTSTTVQGGINAASNYDEVRIIDSREYNENVTVNVTGLTLTSNTLTRPVVWAKSSLPPINITVNNVTVRNLTIIYNGTSSGFGAVTASNRLNVTVANNTIKNTGSEGAGFGIYFTATSSSRVENNSITTSGGDNNVGINLVSSSSSNTVQQNTVSTSGTFQNVGISLNPSSNSMVQQNTISTSGSSSSNNAIRLSSSSNSTVQQNTISTSGAGSDNYGIWLFSSSNSMVQQNTISTSGGSTNYGIYFSFTSSSTIQQNTVSTSGSANNYGIFLQSSSSSNIFRSNNITTNTSSSHGVRIETSNNNTFYDDRINATQAADAFLDGTTAGNDNYFVNVSFNKSDISTTDASVKTKLFNQYRLDVRTIDSSGGGVQGTSVVGNDTNSAANIENPTSNFSATTNSTGYIPQQVLTEFAANGTYTASSGYLYFTNYTINASRAGSSSASAVVNLTASSSVTLTINPPNVCNLDTGSCYNTVQEAINAASNYHRIAIVNASREYNENVIVNVTGLTLTSNTTTKPVVWSSSSGTITVSSGNTTVRNLEIKYNGSSGVHAVTINSVSNVTIDNNTITNSGSSSGEGINSAARSGRITNNTITTSGSTGIGAGNHGIYMITGADSNTVSNNTISTSGSSSGTTGNKGMRVDSGSNTIESNKITTFGGAGNYGMHLPLSSSSNNIVRFNTITTGGATYANTGDYGIFLRDGDNNIISYNTVSTGGLGSDAGIVLDISAANNAISNNTVSTATGGSGLNNYGISISTSGSPGNEIHNNTVNTRGSVTGDFTRGHGIRLASTSIPHTVSNNTISTSGGGNNYGIILSGSSNSNFTSNTITTGGAFPSNHGIFLETSSSSNTFTSNTISTRSTSGTNGDNIGIYLSSSSSNTFSNNTIATSGFSSNHGIKLSSSNSNLFRSSSATANTTSSYGLYIDTSNNNTFYDSKINSSTTSDIFLVGTTAGNDNYLVNSTFNKSDIGVNGPTVQTKLFVQYRLDVRVLDTLSSAVQGVSVTGDDKSSVANTENPSSNFSMTTNSTGYIPQQILSDFMANGTYNSSSGYLYFNNHTVSTSSADYFPETETLNITSDTSLTITVTRIESTIDVTGRSLYSMIGAQITSGTVVGTVLEAGESNSTTISNSDWRLRLSTATELEDKTFTLGIFANDSSGKSGYYVVKFFGSSGLAEPSTCTSQRWRLSGTVSDDSGSPVSGTVRADIEDTAFSNSTSFSNGAWEVFISPCLISGKLFTFKVFLSTSDGRTGLITLKHVAK